MRNFIKQKFNEDQKVRSKFINRLRSGDWRAPHLNWLIPMIAELTTKHDRLSATKLLARIDTPDAYALAEKLAADADEDIASAAKQQLEIRVKRVAAPVRRR